MWRAGWLKHICTWGMENPTFCMHLHPKRTTKQDFCSSGAHQHAPRQRTSCRGSRARRCPFAGRCLLSSLLAHGFCFQLRNQSTCLFQCRHRLLSRLDARPIRVHAGHRAPPHNALWCHGAVVGHGRGKPGHAGRWRGRQAQPSGRAGARKRNCRRRATSSR